MFLTLFINTSSFGMSCKTFTSRRGPKRGLPAVTLRLFVFSSGISHSVTSDMQTIEQESPTLAKPRKKYQEDSEDSYFSSSSR